MNIFAKPPSVLASLGADLALFRAPQWAASLPSFTIPRICESSIMAEIERSLAPMRRLQATCEAMAKAARIGAFVEKTLPESAMFVVE